MALNLSLSSTHSSDSVQNDLKLLDEKGDEQFSKSVIIPKSEISFSDIKPVNVQIRNLSLFSTPRRLGGLLKPKEITTVKLSDPEKQSTKSNQILHDISLDVPSGSIMAIIGGSGSGKTSLLNQIAQRSSSKGLTVQGKVYFNGQEGINNITHAYVIQQDILLPNLTCRETLQYAAELRIPSSVSKSDRKNLVEEVILELGLKDCSDTIVGDSRHKGLSGGEKRRLSIGIQMLSNPSVLFLDEPTTGLDSNSAYLLIKTLKQLSKRGNRTFILSIHQPRSDIFFLFDSLCILSKGKTIYTGLVKNTISYFENLGFYVPDHVNPADYFIDISSIDSRSVETEQTSTERVKRLVNEWKPVADTKFNDEIVSLKQITTSQRRKISRESKAPLSREILILIKRTTILTSRDLTGTLGLYLEALVLGTIVGWVFYKPGDSLTGIRTTAGALYTATALQGYLLLLFEIYRLTAIDIQVFHRERSESCVSVLGFLISRRVSKFLTEDFFIPLLFSIVTFFMFGLRNSSPKYFFIYFANNFLNHLTSMCLAMMSTSISNNFAQASLVANLAFTLQSMACGFFVNSNHMPVYVRWTKYIAYIYYGLGVSLSNQFDGYFGSCPYGDELNPNCEQYTGSFIIKSFAFPVTWIKLPICIVFAWGLGFYIVSGIIFSINKVDVTMAKRHKSNIENNPVLSEDEKGGKAKAMSAPGAEIDVIVDLNNINLSVSKQFSIFNTSSSTKHKHILDSISASFEPHKINVIMGPSGSGKSSLLNLIADRLKSGIITRYNSSGEIYVNNQIISSNTLKSICSYVSQDDDSLLPTLTVRETLEFAAKLRLPKTISKNQRNSIVTDIINKMGLKECSDTLVGSEFVKGISGGEKRRVSISIQLLNNPKILLLDEPTSGLDSFIAASILKVLQDLANEGRTIISTIHQPRSDLFKQFGRVLLLAKGGKVVFNGDVNNMEEYFKNKGYPCPNLTNPADHYLDVISVNLQSLKKEEISRKRVDGLIDNWKGYTEKQKENSSLINVSPIAINHDTNLALPTSFGSFTREPAPFMLAYSTLLRRQAICIRRNTELLFARIMQIIGIGIILALYFAPVRHNYYDIMNRLGLVQEITSLYFIGMLNNVALYPLERDFFYEEHDDNVYTSLPFILAYSTLELPFEIFASIIFSVFIVLVVGLPRTAQMFFSTMYCSVIIVNCGESIGIAFNTVFKHTGFAVNVISTILSIGTCMAGIMSLNMSKVLKGFNYLSPLNYAINALINMAFKGQTFKCNDSLKLSNGECSFNTGEQVLESYGLKKNYNVYLGILIVVGFIYRLLAIAFVCLNRLRLDKRHDILLKLRRKNVETI